MYIFTLRKLTLSRESRLHFEVHCELFPTWTIARACVFVDSPQLEWPICMGSKRYPAIFELLTLGGTPSQDSRLKRKRKRESRMTLSLFRSMCESHTVRGRLTETGNLSSFYPSLCLDVPGRQSDRVSALGDTCNFLFFACDACLACPGETVPLWLTWPQCSRHKFISCWHLSWSFFSRLRLPLRASLCWSFVVIAVLLYISHQHSFSIWSHITSGTYSFPCLVLLKPNPSSTGYILLRSHRIRLCHLLCSYHSTKLLVPLIVFRFMPWRHFFHQMVDQLIFN